MTVILRREGLTSENDEFTIDYNSKISESLIYLEFRSETNESYIAGNVQSYLDLIAKLSETIKAVLEK